MAGLMSNSEKRWKSVRKWIALQIQSGEWPAGHKLPSIRSLSKLFDVSVATIQRALSDLELSSFIEARPKKGYFVLTPSSTSPLNYLDYNGVSVNVNHAVVNMLAKAGQMKKASLSSAVLQDDLKPDAYLKKCMVACANRYEELETGFLSPPGLTELRRRLAGLMVSRGVSCGPDDILITSGDTVALELALEAAAPGEGVIAIEYPTYYGILQIIERLGKRALPIRTNQFTGIDVSELKIAARHQKLSAVFLNPTLQNPRGFTMPDSARVELVEFCEEEQIPIIEDDVFYDLLPTENRPKAIKAYGGESTIYCSSFSKTVAPGYRIGWCVPGKYRTEILAQMFSRNLSVSSISQNVITIFLERNYLEDHCENLRYKLSIVTDYLTNLIADTFPSGTFYYPPKGGFIHWISLPSNTDIPMLVALCSKAGLHISDSGIFFPDGVSSTSIRICLGTGLTASVKRNLRILSDCTHQSLKQ
ncbi:PLP-dependent aminotransferase family protein [Vibrio cholerae]|nr:PLP-dependent aminotransferase family protein [Vibrio paracholerae]